MITSYMYPIAKPLAFIDLHNNYDNLVTCIAKPLAFIDLHNNHDN